MSPRPLPSYLYKIVPEAPPSPLPARLPLSDLDRDDGFIHLSTSRQTASTADGFFGRYSVLWLLKIEYDVLAAGTDGDGTRGGGEGEEGGKQGKDKAQIRWEQAGNECFAHLYAARLGHGNVLEVMRVEKKNKKESWAQSLVDLEW